MNKIPAMFHEVNLAVYGSENSCLQTILSLHVAHDIFIANVRNMRLAVHVERAEKGLLKNYFRLMAIKIDSSN